MLLHEVFLGGLFQRGSRRKDSLLGSHPRPSTEPTCNQGCRCRRPTRVGNEAGHGTVPSPCRPSYRRQGSMWRLAKERAWVSRLFDSSTYLLGRGASRDSSSRLRSHCSVSFLFPNPTNFFPGEDRVHWAIRLTFPQTSISPLKPSQRSTRPLLSFLRNILRNIRRSIRKSIPGTVPRSEMLSNHPSFTGRNHLQSLISLPSYLDHVPEISLVSFPVGHPSSSYCHTIGVCLHITRPIALTDPLSLWYTLKMCVHGRRSRSFPTQGRPQRTC